MSKESRKALINLNGLGVVFGIGGTIFSGLAFLTQRFDLIAQGAIVIGIGLVLYALRLCLQELIEINERNQD